MQHICLYPGMEQYRINTSIRQNTERSPRQRAEEEGAVRSGLDLDNHRTIEFLCSPVQGGAWQLFTVTG